METVALVLGPGLGPEGVVEAREVLLQGNGDATPGLSADEVETLPGLLRRVLANVEEMDA